MSFIVVDVEADGPYPPDYSMVSFGAIVVEPSLNKTFYGTVKPISEIWVPEAMDEPIVLIDFPTNGWCHMVANSIPTLHKFAERLGVNKCWFENKRGKCKPHYDIKEYRVKEAIKLGAKQVSSQKIVEFLKQHYGK